MSIFAPFAFMKQPSEPIPLDPDAIAFLTAAGITDPTISAAINTLVVDLKAASLWTEMQIVYPLVGGTASTCKWNLMNPVDSDAAYRMIFPNGGTFSAGGWATNGTNQYGDTNLIGTSIGNSVNDFHVSLYADDIIAESGLDFGTRSSNNFLGGNLRNGNSQYNARAFNGTITQSAIGAQTATQGFYTISRQLSTSFIFGFDGAYITATQPSLAQPGYNLLFGAYSDIGNPGQFNSRKYQTLTVGNGLSSSQLDTLQTIVETFNNSLSR